MCLDNNYIDKIQKTNFQPIFILGFHRSGTSILYKILAKTKYFNYVKAYHIIKYDELLYNQITGKEKQAKQSINDYLQKHRQTDRGIDKLKISADFEEEYGFLLIKKLNKPLIDEKILDLFNEFCKKIQFLNKNGKPLLLKNPWDFSNFVFIKEKIPNARFIFIQRNPLNIINSEIRSIENHFKKKNYYEAILYGKYGELYDNPLSRVLIKSYLSNARMLRCIHLANNYSKKGDYFVKNIKQLDKNSYVSIKYEDLCEKTNSEIGKIFDFLKIKPPFEQDFSSDIKPRNPALINEINITKSYIFKKMNNYFSYFNYRL